MSNNPEACPPSGGEGPKFGKAKGSGMNLPSLVPKVIVMHRSEDEPMVPGLMHGELDEMVDCIKVNVKGEPGGVVMGSQSGGCGFFLSCRWSWFGHIIVP